MRISTFICLVGFVAGGCYSNAVEAVHKNGGITVQEGLLIPNTRVIFRAEEKRLDDQQFRQLFPSIQQLRPYGLYLEDMDITDASIPLIRKLDPLISLNVERTPMTTNGLRGLRGMPKLNQIIVSKDQVSEQEEALLESHLKKVDVVRKPR